MSSAMFTHVSMLLFDVKPQKEKWIHYTCSKSSDKLLHTCSVMLNVAFIFYSLMWKLFTCITTVSKKKSTMTTNVYKKKLYQFHKDESQKTFRNETLAEFHSQLQFKQTCRKT